MKKLLLLVCSIIILGGCTQAMILNYENQPIPEQLTMVQVEECIFKAGTKLGWKMRQVGPGLIEGMLNVRKHSAIVEIPYSTRFYSIHYKDSTNLSKKGEGTIHKTYNRWIRNLDREINVNLVSKLYEAK